MYNLLINNCYLNSISIGGADSIIPRSPDPAYNKYFPGAILGSFHSHMKFSTTI